MKKWDIGSIVALVIAVLMWIVPIGGLVWWLASPQKSQSEWRAAQDREREQARQRIVERQSRFAAAHGAVWPELMMQPDKGTLLAVDVQRHLMPGVPVAFDVWFPDVRDDRGVLVLAGTILFSSVPLEAELTMEPPWVQLVRTNRLQSLWVVAQIESVTPRREMRTKEGGSREETVYRAAGRTLAVQVPE